jgi:hypothetical protein
MNPRKRCPSIEIGHGAHFWRLDGRRIVVQPAPGVLYCPGATSVARDPFPDPSIAEQLSFAVLSDE